MVAMWVGRILVFSNIFVPAVANLFGVAFGWWQVVYAALTAIGALVIGIAGKPAAVVTKP